MTPPPALWPDGARVRSATTSVGREDYFSRTIVNEPGRAAGCTSHPAFNVTLQPSPCRVAPSSGPVTGTDSVDPSAARKTPPLAVSPFLDLPNGKIRTGVRRHARPDGRDAVGEAQLVAQVRFVEWTAEEHLRHAAFLGLRTDKRSDGGAAGALSSCLLSGAARLQSRHARPRHRWNWVHRPVRRRRAPATWARSRSGPPRQPVTRAARRAEVIAPGNGWPMRHRSSGRSRPR